MDDYYDLLGVEPDAPVDDIRAAYRDRKAEVSARSDDDAKADAAALNKAWNVLSDPYQRGRYDQQLADSDGSEYDEDEDNDDVVDVPATRTRTTRTNQSTRAEGRAARRWSPTIKLPRGVTFPPTRARIVAMVIDLRGARAALRRQRVRHRRARGVAAAARAPHGDRRPARPDQGCARRDERGQEEGVRQRQLRQADQRQRPGVLRCQGPRRTR